MPHAVLSRLSQKTHRELTHREMSALAQRFEARAASVLLRDQPELQSDMWLAARLISEWARSAEQAPPHPGEAR